MAGLLAGLVCMAILMSVALPTWRQAMQREKEEELIFRGKQYARAVELFQRRFANAFPPTVDILIDQKFLRKKYKDPMTEDGEFQLLYQLDAIQQGGQGGQSSSQPGRAAVAASPSGRGGQTAGQSSFSSQASVGAPRGGMIGVVSKSKEKSIRLYNGRNYYNEWQFVYMPVTVGGAGGIGGGMQQRGMQRGGAGGQGGMGAGGGGRGGRGGGAGMRGGGRGGPGGEGMPGGGRGGPGGQGFPPGGQGFPPGGQGGPGRAGAAGTGGIQRGAGGM